jgi:hypothetical protein
MALTETELAYITGLWKKELSYLLKQVKNN